jgi:hypothetical protein
LADGSNGENLELVRKSIAFVSFWPEGAWRINNVSLFEIRFIIGRGSSILRTTVLTPIMVNPKFKGVHDEKGAFKRPDSIFRNWVSADPNAEFPAEADRYVGSDAFVFENQVGFAFIACLHITVIVLAFMVATAILSPLRQSKAVAPSPLTPL